MKNLKIVSVVGTRPEIIRLSRVLAKLDKYCDHILIHTGQNYDYELNQIFFDDLGVRKPDYFLNSAVESISAANTIGNLIISVDKVLADVEPDAMLVLGDTNSCLSVIPAKRRKIPIFHMEAGNRCFDMRVPEEINRRIVDHTSDINLTYSTIARDYLLREGLYPDQVIKTGSPMYEVLHYYLPQIESSNILSKLNLESNSYYVVSAHREENIIRGREILEKIFGKNGFEAFLKSPSMQLTAEKLNYQGFEDLLAALGYGEITSNAIVNSIRDESNLNDQGKRKELQLNSLSSKNFASGTLSRSADKQSFSIDGVEGIKYQIAGCCKPIPGEPIIGIIRRNGKGLVVHNQNCSNVQEVINNSEERVIPIQWNSGTDGSRNKKATYPVDIKIEAFDRVGVLKDILTHLTEYGINVSKASVITNEDGKPALMELRIDVEDREQLDKVLARLRRMSDGLRVNRFS